ncbi:MAG: transcriptional repressor [Rubrivivax sp.]
MPARAGRHGTTALPAAASGVPARLRAVGLRPTTARVAIVQALEAADAPLTAEALFRALTRRGVPVGLATTYRSLAELASAGLLLRAWVQGHAGAKVVYAVTAPAEGRVPARHRLTCARCGRCVFFTDAGLTQRLRQAAGLGSLDAPAQGLTITVGCLGCSPACAGHRQAAAAD